jgi:hypothetical protein
MCKVVISGITSSSSSGEDRHLITFAVDYVREGLDGRSRAPVTAKSCSLESLHRTNHFTILGIQSVVIFPCKCMTSRRIDMSIMLLIVAVRHHSCGDLLILCVPRIWRVEAGLLGDVGRNSLTVKFRRSFAEVLGGALSRTTKGALCC